MSMQTTSGGTGAGAWQVTNIQITKGPDQVGRYVAGYTVTYQLQSGETGQLFIPKTVGTAGAAAALINADAAQLAGIAGLRQGM